MKIKFKQQIFSPVHGKFLADRVYALPDAFAKTMTQAKYATEVPADTPAENEQPPAAAAQPPAAGSDTTPQAEGQ